MNADLPGTIPLRLTDANRHTLARGIEVTFVRIAEGVDGVYELEIKGHGEPPLSGSVEPAVPLEPDA